MLREVIEQGGREDIDKVMAAIESTDAIEYTSRLAREEADKAKAVLSQLPDSPYREALSSIADFSVIRSN
jgi:octaprenyl-diphosphate synthase